MSERERRLEEIRERCEKATPGPWERCQFGDHTVDVSCKSGVAIVPWTGFDDSDREFSEHLANAAFIASARQDIPYLLSLLTEPAPAPPPSPVAEQSCETCEGEGVWIDEGEPSTCDDCGGSGRVPLPSPVADDAAVYDRQTIEHIIARFKFHWDRGIREWGYVEAVDVVKSLLGRRISKPVDLEPVAVPSDAARPSGQAK